MDSKAYPIVEIFSSMQGEGFNTGRPCTFVRLAGCNLSCPWCDTDHQKAMDADVTAILNVVAGLGLRSVVITGGEPTIHDLGPLLRGLREAGLWVALETNGTGSLAPYSDLLDYVAVSPKIGCKEILAESADEVRVVVTREVTQEWLRFVQEVIPARHYFLSPLFFEGAAGSWEIMPPAMHALGQANTDPQMKRPWFLSIQTHKLANIQ